MVWLFFPRRESRLYIQEETDDRNDRIGYTGYDVKLEQKVYNRFVDE